MVITESHGDQWGRNISKQQKPSIQNYGTYIYIDAIFRLGVHFSLTVHYFKLEAHVINRNGVLASKVLTCAYKREINRWSDVTTD